MLKLDLSPGESVRIGHDVVLTLEKKTGQVARLSFVADRNIPIKRVGNDNAATRQTFGITGQIK